MLQGWLLARLVKVCKSTNQSLTPAGAGLIATQTSTIDFDLEAMELACRELNANVSCPGVAPNTDAATVTACLTGCAVTLLIPHPSSFTPYLLSSQLSMNTFLY